MLAARQILDTALALVDERGTDALTVRGVAAALDVAPNALYTYFPNRDALRAALVEHLLGELDGVKLPADWPTALRHLAGALRALLARHPGAVPLFVAGPMFGPHGLHTGERVLALLAGAGFTPTAAARALYTVLAYTLGFAAMDAAELTPGAPADMDTRVAQRRTAFEAVPAADYPHTHAAAAVMATYVTDTQFRSGLDTILAGLARSAAPPSR